MRAGLAVLLLALVAALALRDARTQLQEPLPIPEPVFVDVPRGASLNAVLAEWQALGYLASWRQRQYLSVHARLTGRAQAIKAGEYRLEPGLSALDLTALLVAGRVYLHELQVLEGWRFAQMLEVVGRHPALRRTLPDLAPATVMKALGHPGLHPEGRFFPDTYRFPRGTTDVAFLGRAFTTMEHAVAAEWEGRAPDLPYRNPQEALVMASIVERETGAPAERAQIAGVFVRRLALGMLLQTDPSVIYGLGAQFDGNLRKRDLLADTPYNTYTRRGLPPTPICLPGRAALHAALHPDRGPALYFVSRGDGTHQFSATFAEHDAAVRKFQLRRRRR